MAEAMRWMPVKPSLQVLRRLLMALLTTLVVLQTMAVMHRVVHVQSNPSQPDLLAAIWCDDQNPGLCQLIDHACADVLATSTMATVAMPAFKTWSAFSLHERFALFERFYAARGPPAVLL
jgi:hypothetical protein